MLQLFNGEFFDADMDELRTRPGLADAVNMLDALLNEVADSEEAMWKLTHRSDQHYTPYFDCKVIDCFLADGYNVYRLRPLGARLNAFRVIYAYDPRVDEFFLLAAVLKGPRAVPPPGPNQWKLYGYQTQHPTSQRIRDEYDNQCIPRIA